MTKLTEKTYIGGAEVVLTLVSDLVSESKATSAPTSMNLEKATKLIKSLRDMKGWSQGELADRSGCSLRTIQRLEKGENVRLDVFLDILSAFKLEIYLKEEEEIEEKL